MYYRKALMLQSYLERATAGGLSFYEFIFFFFGSVLLVFSMILEYLSISDTEAAISINGATDTGGFELSPEARAQADLKFTYVVTCQIYGKQKEDQKPEAADIALLMQR